MSKKVILLLLFTACNLFLFNNYVFNNAVQAPAGYTNAPGDNGGCKTSGCHVGATEFTGGNATDINFGFFSGSHTAYTKNDNYIFQINFNGSSAQNNYGWQVTALDASGNAIGTLGTQNQSTVALSSQGGRDYVGHFNHSGTGAYIFNWVAPSNYLQGTATFYIAAVSNGGLGERVYYKTFTFDPDSTIVAPSLSADFTVDDTIPCLGETINFTQQSTGNPVGYSWDFGAGATPQTSTDPNPSVVYSSAGLKSVGLTITDSNGDTDRENKINFINVNPGPNADAGSDVVVCSGGTVQLQASGGVAYQWSPSTGLSNANVPNPIAAPSDSTVYSVEVTDSLGCTNSDEVLVAVVNAPVLSLNDTSVCPGDSVVLDAGNPGFDYDWSTGSTDQSIKIGQAGTYSVTVSSGGVCSASDTVVIMHLSAPIADAGSDQSICQGESVQIGSVSLLGQTYLWSPVNSLNDPNLSNPIASPIGSTTYFLRVEDSSSGCEAFDTVFVEVNSLPSVQLSGLDSLYCISDNTPISLTLNPSGGNLTGPGISGTDFTPSAAGIGNHQIIYQYTDPQTNCSNSDTLSVEVVPDPTASFDNLQTEYCIYDNDFVLQGSPVGGVFYINGQSETSFSPLALGAGVHDVEYIYTVGTCSDTATEQVMVIGNIQVSIDPLGAVFCKGDNTPYALSGTPAGGTFSGFGVQGSDFIPALAGVGTGPIRYEFDTAVCTFVSFLPVTVHGVELGNDTSICEGDSALLDASVLISNIQWSTGETTPTIKVSPSVSTTEMYIVSGTDAEGCATSDTVEVTTVPRPSVSFTNLDSTYCSTDAIVTLTGTPSGGVFSGPGVIGNLFDPANAGVGGPHTITYTYQTQAGCQVSSSQEVLVLQGFSNPDFIGLDSIYCVNNGAVMLQGTPAGGVFSGTGVVDSAFLPYFAGVGIHNLSYGIQSGNGCGAVKTVQVEVKARPQVQFDPLPASVCSNSGSIALSASPQGGVFNGSGVQDSIFNPALVNVGNTNVISYTYTDSFSCSRKVDQMLSVLPKPNASINGHPVNKCEGDNPVVFNGQPAGGQFYINGVAGNTLEPDSSALGVNSIQYVVIGNNACSDTAFSSIRVFARPQVSFNIQENQTCAYPINIGLSVNPAGGVFSGGGVSSENTFIPSNGSIGANLISYTYTDSNACSRTMYDSIEVLALPELQVLGLEAQYCNTDDTVALSLSPAGGLLSGPGISGNNFVPSQAGVGSYNIRYVVTDINNCVNAQSINVSVDNCTGMSDPKKELSWNVYPNPSSGIVNVYFDQVAEQFLKWTLMDLQGKQVLLEGIERLNNPGGFKLDISSLMQGVYLLRVENETTSSVKRIVRY